MAKKQTPQSKQSKAEAIQRRDALKKLGALAICAPTLASMACDDDPEAPDTGMFQGNAEAGVGGNPGGTLDAGGGTTGGGTGGGGTASGGTAGGGTTGGGTPGNGGTSGGGTTGASTGGTTGGGGADAGMGSMADAGAGDAAAGSAGFFPPNFQDAPSCTLTPTDPAGEGPFFLHEMEAMNDTSMVRTDMRDGRMGVELQLNLRLLDQNGNCMTPIADVECYVWHTDALGFYSGFNGQNPNMTYSGGIERTPENNDRFCRGIQVTNAQGVVSFRSLYPGWYNGRPIHIHFVALKKGSGPGTTSYRSADYHIFTTQMYFEEAFSRNIHENNEPYTMRASGTSYSTYIKPGSSTVRPSARMEGNVAVASLNIITNSTQSRGGGGGLGGFFGGLAGG